MDEYVEKIKSGWTDIDVIICTPNVMGKVGALGRILGPRGLMPNPKTGTVTMEVGKAVSEVKSGKIDFKVDKFGIIHTSVGKISFSAEQIADNVNTVLSMIMKLKPAAAKGSYVKSIFLSTTMSPGLQIDAKSVKINSYEKSQEYDCWKYIKGLRKFGKKYRPGSCCMYIGRYYHGIYESYRFWT